MKVLDASQVTNFLTAASGSRLEALFHLAVTTGLRQGELFGLKWSDLQWAAGVLQVQRQVQSVPGQGWNFTEPKTNAGRRSVRIGPGVVDALRRHKERQALEKQLAGSRWVENDLIFPNSVGNPMNSSNLRVIFNRLLNEVGLPKIRFHDLRHTAASLMLNHNIPVIVVSNMLGHSKPSVTLDIYAHLYHESQSEAAQLIDNLVTPVRIEMPVHMGGELHLQGIDLHPSTPKIKEPV
jgi:integrase